ncbi:MAG: 5'-nucleotidase C-terminal domain-containing protein [Bacteroidales bacterium]
MEKKVFFSFIGTLLLFVNLHAQIEHRDTLTIVSFNDFHGAFVEEENIPGAASLTQTIRNIKKTYPNVQVFSVGDNFSGSYFSRITGGSLQNLLFQRTGVRYSSVGNHEFDWGLDSLASIACNGEVQYLAANIFLDSIEQKDSTLKIPYWLKPYAIESLTLSEKPFRIAIIGLTTLETATKTNATNIKGLKFTSPTDMARKMMNILKDSADIYLCLSHIGTDMANGIPVFTDVEVDSLPYVFGVSAFLTGHSHKKVWGSTNGVPILQAAVNGLCVGMLQFEILTDSVGQRNIRYLYGKVIPVGKEKDKLVEQAVDRLLQDTIYQFTHKLTTATEALVHDRSVNKFAFTEMGALVSRAYEKCYKKWKRKTSEKEIVIGISNFGGIRTGFEKGDITVLKAGNVLPFGGEIRACKMNGRELKQLFSYGISCSSGRIQSNNIEITMADDGKILELAYLGKKRRVLKDSIDYVVLAESFITQGGDKYDSTLFDREIVDFNILPLSFRDPTQAFIYYLSTLPEVNSQSVAICKIKKK